MFRIYTQLAGHRILLFYSNSTSLHEVNPLGLRIGQDTLQHWQRHNHIVRSIGLEFFTKNDQYVKRRWRQVQYLANIFWRRWLKEYLPTLQMRQKWCFPEAYVKENDVVLIVNENAPRGQWPLARVVKVHIGKDGKVRSAVVRSSGTDLTRPITKLCLLENVNLAQVNSN